MRQIYGWEHLLLRSFECSIAGKFDTLASIIVSPLQIACGVQSKMLEAMGKTVIASPSACEGIKMENRKDVPIAVTAKELAAAIDEVVAHRAGPLGIAARSRIERDYRWNFAILDRLLDEPALLVVNAR